MRKRLSSLLAVVIMISLTFMLANPVLAVESNDNISNSTNMEMYAQEQESALAAYEMLFNTFEKQVDGSIWYPEEYAGAYIQGSKLIVMLTKVDETVIAKYSSIYPEYSIAVEYKKTDNSLNQLSEIYVLGDEVADLYDIYAYGVDEKNNETFIRVSEEDAASLERRLNERKTTSIPVRIEPSDEDNVNTASLYGGDSINDGTHAYSVCIGGSYNGHNAILTCGHFLSQSASIYRAGNQCGSVAYLRCNPATNENPGINGLGDFSIVTLNTSYTPTNKMRTDTSLVSSTGYYSSVPVGTTVYKYGQKTGYAVGTVEYTGVTQLFDNPNDIVKYRVSGLTQAYMQNSAGTDAIDSGDSGGCVYVKMGSEYKISGSISGMMKKVGTNANHVMYFSPIYYAIDAGFMPKSN